MCVFVCVCMCVFVCVCMCVCVSACEEATHTNITPGVILGEITLLCDYIIL